MVFLVFVTGQASFTCGHLPCVRGVTTGAGKGSVLFYFVETRDVWVTRLAIGHGFDFSFLEMACLTGLRHHRSRGVNFVAGDAVQRRAITRTMAEVAKDLLVFPF